MNKNLINDEVIDAGTVIITEMANLPSEREKLVAALQKNGVTISINSPNDELYTAIFTGIAKSKSFRTDIKKAVYSYLQSKNNNFSQSEREGFFNLTEGEAMDIFKRAGATTGQQVTQATNVVAGGTTTQKSGGFLSGLFTKEQLANYANAGINLISSKLTQKADEKSVQEGIKYQVAKANAAELERQKEEAKKKWVVPVVIASVVVVAGIIGFVIYKNRKK